MCETLGAGEILLRGTGDRAFDVALINAVQNAVNISVLAAPAAGVPITLEDYTRGTLYCKLFFPGGSILINRCVFVFIQFLSGQERKRCYWRKESYKLKT